MSGNATRTEVVYNLLDSMNRLAAFPCVHSPSQLSSSNGSCRLSKKWKADSLDSQRKLQKTSMGTHGHRCVLSHIGIVVAADVYWIVQNMFLSVQYELRILGNAYTIIIRTVLWMWFRYVRLQVCIWPTATVTIQKISTTRSAQIFHQSRSDLESASNAVITSKEW